ncbi:inactivation-no-after-potential D protein isoform X2 [Armigeres subalbatus]|uniref:inactivation-no-after-potential D protein isoform X2 n=1 Tax=Armigeres subalbatus TaxID=124917 RepID=UPI002ED11252
MTKPKLLLINLKYYQKSLINHVMIRFTHYTSDDLLIHRELSQFHGYVLRNRIVKYITSNDYKHISVLNNDVFKPHLLKYLYTKFRLNLCNERYMSISNNVCEKPESNGLHISSSMRREYYNDIHICLKDLKKSEHDIILNTNKDDAAQYAFCDDEMDSSLFPKVTDTMKTSTNPNDMLSSNESTVFLDATEGDYETNHIHDSDDDTIKSATKTSTSKISLDSISLPQPETLADNTKDCVTKNESAMTVMAIENQDVSDSDWGKERDVLIIRDENKSFGISIVGGTVNVSNDTIVSGIFIKNIIPNSPADNCGLLKVGDRILSVDGIDIRQSSHDYALKTIKNADSKMILQVQSLVKKIEDTFEASTILKKIPPPVTPCKTPEPLIIHEGNGHLSSGNENAKDKDENISIKLTMENDSQTNKQADSGPEDSSDDEDARDLEGKTYTKAGFEIDRASAGNIKRTKEEISLDTEEEDCFGYTSKKIKKRYSALGQVIHHSVDRSSGCALGISLAGHRDRTKMACFIAGINPKGSAAAAPFEIGDEILEVNGLVLYGRSHLNVPTIIKSLEGSSLKFIILRRKNATGELAVKPVTQFPVCIDEEATSGLGIMIIEGKHADVGQGIFISDIQEGSMADKAGLNIGEMILAVNKDSLIGCNYETAASLLKKTEGVITLKICNPNKAKESTEANINLLEPKQPSTVSGKTSPVHVTDPKTASRPVTPKPQASPVKEVVDPLKAEVISNEFSTIEINSDKKPLGIFVIGGTETKINGAVIIEILPNSVAFNDKRLQVFDQIVEINGTKVLHDSNEKQVQKAVKQLQPRVRLVVFRPTVPETEAVDVELFKKPGKLLGVGFRANHPHGVVITDMLPGGTAESDGRIRIGDIITSLDSEKLSNLSYDDCSLLFKTAQGKIFLSILRPKPKNRAV